MPRATQLNPRAQDRNDSVISVMWIFQLVHLWPISVLSCMFQHPFPFHSICSPSSQLLLLKCIIHMSWTSQIPTVLILSSAVVFHFASHSDSLIQHQCYSSALVIFSKDSSPATMIYLFPDFFFLSQIFFHLFSFSCHLKAQLPFPWLVSLSILI